MEQNQETLPPPQHLETNSALESTGEPGESKQNSRFSPPKQTLEMESSLRLTTTLRTSRTRADWVNTLWADVSGQLRRLSVISNDLFDGLLLKRYTPTGSLILKELVSTECFAHLSVKPIGNTDRVSAAQTVQTTWRR